MATEYVDLNLERDLVDEDFEKYQLDSTKCPINWIDNEFGAKQIKLADDQFSYQHFITFLNHNGLYKDIWVAEHAYWISENNEICLCSYDIISKKIVIKTRFTLPGHDENVKDRLYSSLSFPSKDYIVCNDGCGNMYLIHTGLRHHNSHHAWKLVYRHKTFEMAHIKSHTKVVKTNFINDEKMAFEPSIILDSVMLSSNNTTHHHDVKKTLISENFIILETVNLCIEERHGKNSDNDDILLTKNESKNFDSIIGTDDDGPPHKRIHHSGNFPKKLAVNPDEAEGKSVVGGDFNPITFVHETGVSEFNGPEKQPPKDLDKTSLQDEIVLTQLHTDELALVNASHKGATHFVSLLEWTTFEISNDGVNVKLKNTRILECPAPIHFASFEVRDCITASRNKSFLPDQKENLDSDKNQVISTTHESYYTNQALHIVSDAPLKFIHHYVTQGSKNDDLLHHKNQRNNLNLKGKQTIPPQMDPEYARFLAAQIQEEADETIEPSSNKSDDIVGFVAKSEMQEITAAYNMQELEECDTFPDNQSCLARYDGNTLSITHQASLSSNKYLFTALSSDDKCPLFALRHDVHATVWKPNHLNSKDRHQSIWQNILTFEALGYVIASKETRKFIAAYVGDYINSHNKDSNHGKTENKIDKFEYQDLAERIDRPTGPYCAIADFTNHIFLYFKSRQGHRMNNTTLESKEPILKNRKTGKIYGGGDSDSKYAMQKLITLDYGKGGVESSNENKPNNGDLNSSTVKGNHNALNNTTILGMVLNPTNIMVLSPNRIWVVEV